MTTVTSAFGHQAHESGRLISGRYRLREVLGRGTTGVVWSAYDEVLYRAVAVKEVLLPAGMPDEETRDLRERTMREARAIAALSHPNVITVYDVAQADGAPFVVMELIQGRSLAALLAASGRLDPTQAATVADALAAALASAHKAGITHRDVKPGNVLIGQDGQVKLTDFGIARNVSDATMTRTGVVLGSPAFIAPEIAAGHSATPAADLWSLGATLFAAACGRPPYDVDGDVLATLNEVVNGPVPDASGSGPLHPVISGLMRRDTKERIGPTQVRRIVYWLLPEPGSTPFPPEATPGPGQPGDAPSDDHADAAKSEPPQARVTTPLPAARPAKGPPLAAQPQQPTPLSAAPGPLPFAPARCPRTRSRGRIVTAALGVAAVLLFAAAAFGGFAAVRMLAGKQVAPQPTATDVASTGPQAPPAASRLAPRAGTAAGARFQIVVPEGWVSFTEQRTASTIPAGTVVHYVSPDGAQELRVERVVGFYRHHGSKGYVSWLRAARPAGGYTLIGEREIRGLSSGSHGSATALQLTYRTVTASRGSGGTSVGRTTVADILPDGQDLWVVSVTVPTDQEDSGTMLFTRIAGSFRPSDR